ncbi:MAG: arsenite methyltransferase [Ignavibacteria bacterium]|nr:arsenite methyltransferase [Ignavibacteria bacterium]
MKNNEELKKIVRDKYAEIAVLNEKKSCCRKESNCCDSKVEKYTVFQDDYSKLDGYVAEADLKLGCGVPTQFAGINKGDTVVDLGSGAGNDVFVARALTGADGKVVGIDMTIEMIQKANVNKVKSGFTNVEFRLGDIENMPVEKNFADVVLSNCVLNLVPDKMKAFAEIYRILKPGGHFCISDIVLKGTMPEKLKESAALYAGCVSGAIDQDEYLKIVTESGFTNVEIKRSVANKIPEDLLKEFLTSSEIIEFEKSLKGIFSITVVGYK